MTKKYTDEQIYNELYKLREQIKNEYIIPDTNKPPRVCDTSALEKMAHFRPRTRKEIDSISGLGEMFMLNFADMFIDKINELEGSKKVKLNEEEIVVLKKLENRLVNINQRNRLLYSSKIKNEYGIDIVKNFEHDYHAILEFILSRDKAKYNLTRFITSDESTYKTLVKIKRNIEKSKIETGNNELYIAYPFVQGKSEEEMFNYKAPLALFPVDIIREEDGIFLINDFDREIIYNSTLILANNKFNKLNKVLPDDEVEEYNQETFINDMLKYYSENKIYIKNNGSTLEKFLENTKETFPKYNNGELEIKNYLVLGIYSTYASSLYKDFEKMIESNDVTDSIKSLLTSGFNKLEEVLYEEIDDKNFTKEKSIENDIFYINEMDASQEQVLKLIQEHNAVVIQGPPGTGKSQTITSIIAQAVLEDKKVLMVSEKKTALDVIYSRLGDLSDFALLIDDIEDKGEFYSKLDEVVELITEWKNVSNNAEEYQNEYNYKISEMVSSINESLTELQQISQIVYGYNNFGTTLFKLYCSCEKFDLNNEADLNFINYCENNFPEYLNQYTFNDYENAFKNFSSSEMIYKMTELLNITNKYYKFLALKDGLGELDVNALKQIVTNFVKNMGELKQSNFLVKKIKEMKLIKEIKQGLAPYIDSINRDSEKEFYRSIVLENELFVEYLNIYRTRQNILFIYNKLNNFERLLIEFINEVMSYFKMDFYSALFYIRRYKYYKVIVELENANPNVLNYINNFDEIRNNISKCISYKVTLTKKLAYNKLFNKLRDLDLNNSFEKIYKAIEKKRKPAISKFMNNFSLELMDCVKIWMMTPEVVSDILPFRKDMFDIVIFDEASQLYVEKAIPAIYRGEKLVVAGDQKQLKPSSLGKGRILDEIDEDVIENVDLLEYESLLDTSENKFRNTMLEYHYRSKYSELIAFSNAAFYKNRLLVSANSSVPTEPPIERIFVEDGRWIQKKNIQEANRVIKLVKEILINRKENETIGVITFNSSQMSLIEDEIEKEKGKDPQFNTLLSVEEKREENGENKSFFVKNIETVQGDERDIIIFCVGYAKNEIGRVSIQFGWLNNDGGENRLNVAVSRAKKKIYVITSIEPEELLVENTENDGPKIFKKYLQYAKAISNNDKEQANAILMSFSETGVNDHQNINIYDSPFEEEVHNFLIEKGYNVVTQYGVGGYKIDLVLQTQDGQKNILGIECDGRLYHSSKSARERDFHRQKYLESRGWRLYRIWSTNWWSYPQQEKDKLIKYIEFLLEIENKKEQ